MYKVRQQNKWVVRQYPNPASPQRISYNQNLIYEQLSLQLRRTCTSLSVSLSKIIAVRFAFLLIRSFATLCPSRIPPSLLLQGSGFCTPCRCTQATPALGLGSNVRTCLCFLSCSMFVQLNVSKIDSRNSSFALKTSRNWDLGMIQTCICSNAHKYSRGYWLFTW